MFIISSMLVCEAPTFEDMPDLLKVEPDSGGIGRAGVGASGGAGVDPLAGGRGTSDKVGAVRGPLTPLLLTELAAAPLSCKSMSKVDSTAGAIF
jgi:hypothetical protein